MNNQEMMELTTVDKSEFEELVKECTRSGSIDQNLYIEYDVKRGLRDSNGNGVLTGLTEISDVCGNENVHTSYYAITNHILSISTLIIFKVLLHFQKIINSIKAFTYYY